MRELTTRSERENKEREASGKPFPSLLFVSVLNFIPFFVLWFHLLVKKRISFLYLHRHHCGERREDREGAGLRVFPLFVEVEGHEELFFTFYSLSARTRRVSLSSLFLFLFLFLSLSLLLLRMHLSLASSTTTTTRACDSKSRRRAGGRGGQGASLTRRMSLTANCPLFPATRPLLLPRRGPARPVSTGARRRLPPEGPPRTTGSSSDGTR